MLRKIGLFFSRPVQMRHISSLMDNKQQHLLQIMSSFASSPSSNLIRLDAVGEKTRDWNYEKPTLVQDGRYTSKLPTNTETFRQKFYENYPALKDLKMDNIVFKGGSILDLLIGQQPRDLDLFLVGLDSEEKALARVKELLSNFLQIEKDLVERKRENERARCRILNRPVEEGQKFDEQIKAIRNGVVITLTQSSLPIPIQIVLLRYDSVAHCLEDDDLGATAIAFDGQDVWLNECSKFAIENITIVVEPTRQTGPTPKRLEKYFYKGFDLVLPQLDMAKLPRHYQGLGSLRDVAQLPGLCFAYQKLEGNKIFVDHFVQLKEEKEAEQLVLHSRRAYTRSSGGDQNGAAILAKNIAKLCGGENEEEGKEEQMGKQVEEEEEDNFVLCAEGDFVLNVLRVWPGIQPRQINNFYRRWRSQLVNREQATFNYAIAQRHFGMYTVAETAEKLFKAKDMDKALDLLTQEHINRAVKKLQQWLSKGCKDALVSVPKKADKGCCQIFPTTYKQDRDFYGDFYKADE